MAQYDYTKSGVNPSKLQMEIDADQDISQDVDYIIFNEPDDLQIYFESDLSGAEQTELQTLVTNHTASSIGEKNFKVTQYDTRKRRTKETWYNTDDGDDTYSGKVEEITYTYQNSSNKLLSKNTKTFYLDGTEISSETTNFYENDSGDIIEKNI